MKRFLSELRIAHIDGRTWRLLDDFIYYIGSPEGDEFVIVRAGFITDFASVPRVLWALYPPYGQYSPAALVHDELYIRPVVRRESSERPITRAEADGIFLEAMGVLGVPNLRRHLMYSGVRAGGWVPWDRYRRADASHEGSAAL